MRRISVMFGVLGLLTLAVSAFATPAPNSAVLITRVFNDCPGSVLATTNTYPALINITDQNVGCVGFANLHVWRLSENGSTAAIFNNGDAFRICSYLVIDGTGHAEAGLQVRPWWSEADGRFNVRTTDGEVACFGGRLPFYSFTAQHGVVYVKGTPIQLEMIYLPNGLSAADPATMEYKLTYNANSYSSGPLPFDEGNPNEDPPYGLWGILNQAQVGGYQQFFVAQSGATGNSSVTWRDICFEGGTVAVEDKSWGSVKGLFR